MVRQPQQRAGPGLGSLAGALLVVCLVGGLSSLRAGRGLDLASALVAAARPSGVAEWTTTAGILVLAGLGGLATGATFAARRGLEPRTGR
jgi:hypothetical protein